MMMESITTYLLQIDYAQSWILQFPKLGLICYKFSQKTDLLTLNK